MINLNRGLAVIVTALAGSVGCISKNYYQPFSYVVKNIEYEHDEYDHWQIPNKTRRLKTGDCEDMAILLLDEWRKNGIEGRLVVGYLHWYDFGAFILDKQVHAWCEVRYKGKLYVVDPTNDLFFRKGKKLDMKRYEELEDNDYIKNKKLKLERDIKKGTS